MKHPSNTGIISLAISLVIASSAAAALSFSPGYSATSYHVHGNGDGIISYDWGSDGALYYATADSSFLSSGVYRHDGTSTTTIQNASGNFAGGSVVAIGSSVYFNDSTFSNTQNIYRYSIGAGTTTTAALTNYSLGSYDGHLYSTGGDFSGTRLTYYVDGLTGGTIDLGGVAGASGPLTFDAAGNLYYAPGYGDLAIYRWDAAEVTAAISGNGSPSLSASGHLWIDYSTAFATAGGATSMLTDAEGNLLVTLTNFTDPSALVKFSADGSGNYETILTSLDRLGELRAHDGQLYLSSGNSVMAIIPEPSTLLLGMFAWGGFFIRRRR
ncbi:hypothetical protein JIN84_13575 [Luteolibacter yonseiensis]|uniref:PEP-CTERM protein-sorting domain-containing protein n=1 Tax=Luteolibacter yonseiensis TaxID=1144680 RepID=A0A934VC00_9BACT|nr:PEP-CTERM sorting domain-containing protein [Luteolibacter yonseiensis]MBK1816650.1 hypothetical protein [Luteolibacter yonseiensis]